MSATPGRTPLDGSAPRREPAFQPERPGARRFAADPLPSPAGFRRDGEPAAAPSAPAASVAPPPPDLEALAREAYERGVADGRAALPWDDAEQLRSATRAFAAAAAELAGARRSYLIENRRTVVELACAIAERVLAAPAAAGRDALAALVARALELFPPEEPLSLHLAEADRAVVTAGLAEELARLESEGRVRIVPDATLARGEARVLGRSGDVRASVAEVLERVRAELADALAVEAPPPAPDPADPGESS